MMKPPKEVLAAVVLGVVVGVVVAYGLWTANRALRQSEIVSPNSQKTEEAGLEVAATPTPVRELAISEPAEETWTDQPAATVTGTAPLGSLVVVMGESKEQISEVDSQGVFSTEIELIKGLNEIKVAAVDPEGNQTEQSVTVVYSTVES